MDYQMKRPQLMNTSLRARVGGRMVLLAVLAASASGLILPAPASAHPMGNYTINRYNGLTIGPAQAQVDRVVDMAEIPALQATQAIDLDANATVSDAEGATWAASSCASGADDLALTIDGSPASLRVVGLGLSFPPGQAGLSTLRLVCTYSATYPALSGLASIEFRDGSFPGRLGWQEIVVVGNGAVLSGADDLAAGSSERLRVYPPAAIQTPLTTSRAEFTATPAGPAATLELPTDAAPVGSAASQIMSDSQLATVRTDASDLPSEISAIFQAQDLTLPAILLSIGVAMLIGAAHAASPGHGKTLMAAYLVGTRGTVRHALGLGLTVTISHTIGVLALGAIVLAAGAFLPSERLFPVLGLMGGLVVTAIGLTMLTQRWRAGRVRAMASSHDHATHAESAGIHDHGHDHGHSHDHGLSHDHDGADAAHDDRGWHSHGLVRHTHLPSDENPLRRRNLVALGLVGGLVPSASAVLILVAAIAANRPAFGILLTLAFGLGMASVLVGVGVLLVHARTLVERLPSARRLMPIRSLLPLATAAVFLIVGSAMTIQAGLQLR